MYQLDGGQLGGASNSVGEASSTQGGEDWRLQQVKVITSREFDLSDFCEETIAKFNLELLLFIGSKVNYISHVAEKINVNNHLGARAVAILVSNCVPMEM